MKDGEEQYVVTSEERHTRIKADAADRMKIHEAISTCIDYLKVTSIQSQVLLTYFLVEL